jgi:tetratricopeptide (TPR) repeat protein
MGGVGKTQLIQKYIADYGHYYNNVFWIVAADELKLSTSYKDIAFKLGLRFTEEVPNSSREALRTWLDNHDDWLLVFDNADKSSILVAYLPSLVRGHMLITSRGAELVESRRVQSGIELKPLSITEGAEFLLRGLTGSPLLQDDSFVASDAAKVSKRLGGHPLALAHAASLVYTMGCTFEEYLELYETQQEALVFEHEAEAATLDYELSYATCFKLSIDQLKTTPAGRMLAMLSVLDPDNIPIELFKGYVTVKKPTREIPPLRNLGSYLRATAELKEHALIQQDLQQSSFSIHRIVQDAGVHEFWHDDKAQSLFDDTVACLERVYPTQLNGESMSLKFKDCRIWTPHVTALIKSLDRVNASREEAGSGPVVIAGQHFAEVLANVGWYLYEIGQKNAAMEVLNVGKTICEQLFGDDPNPLTALIYNNIGAIHNSRAETKQGLDCAMKTLTIREECLGPTDPETGNSYTNLAGALQDLNQLEDAQEYFEKALNVHKNGPYESADLLEGAYSNLGRNLMALNRLDEAETAFKDAFRYHPRLEPGSFFTALTLFLWGNLRIRQGQWAGAKTFHAQALAWRQDNLGPDHNLTGVSHHTIAHIHQHDGEIESAIQSLRHAIAVFEKQEQGEPGLLPRSYFKLAEILLLEAREHDQNDLLKESRDLKNEAVALCQGDDWLKGKPHRNEGDWNNMVQFEYRY